jgi:hypothetical protein
MLPVCSPTSQVTRSVAMAAKCSVDWSYRSLAAAQLPQR